ncbi:MAG TPA: HEAT repeat domain-containing protein [Planctomycetota bacterium]|nr:HEAT repeat domain-containing protein [Planctomycetota bacterium]
MTTQPEISSLINVLRENKKGLSEFAIRKLATIGDPAIPELIKTLEEPDDHTPHAAAIALRTMGPASIPPLLKAMHHKSRRICWGAAWVLASIPEARDFIPPVELPGERAAKEPSGQTACVRLPRLSTRQKLRKHFSSRTRQQVPACPPRSSARTAK